MKTLKECINLLYVSRNKSVQVQQKLICDINRRGFLKQVIQVTLFSAFSLKCSGVSDYLTTLPDMGDADRTSLSSTDANFLGQQVIEELINSGEMIKDYDALAYLNDLGNNLVSYSPMAGQDFNFYLIKGKEINAFALPGGYICIYNGLIYTAQSESELTAVMSHEIGHIVQHHIFRNIAVYSRNEWLELVTLLTGGLLATVNPGAGIIAAQSGSGLALQNILAFSRDFEREADRVGQLIMSTAGFDPHAMPVFFERLQAQNRFNNDEAYEFLMTHPVTSQRISEAETRANQLKVKMRPDSRSFLLVREKCRTRQLGALSAIDFYQRSLKTKRYSSIDAKYYGLAFAEYSSARYADSLKTLTKLSDPEWIIHPAVLSLQAQLLTELNSYTKADMVYTQGLENYPNYKNLWINQVYLYLKADLLNKASLKLDDLSELYPHDPDVWQLEAELYSDAKLNDSARYHYALGNLSYLLGKYKDALEQYQKAIANTTLANATLNDIISAKILDTRNMIKTKAQFSS